MTYTIAQLATELTTDPSNNGYAQYVTAGNTTALAGLLNSLTAPGAATISMPSMTNAAFVLAFAPYLANVLTLSAPKQTYYINLLWPAILQMNPIYLSNATVQALMAQAVVDGLLTSAQAVALNQRTGSTAEVRWGAGTVVPWTDVAKAL